MNKHNLYIALVVLSAVSCSNEKINDDTQEPAGTANSVIRMSVDDITFADETKSTASVGESGLNFLWSKGDKVGVYTQSDGFALYNLAEGQDTGNGVFDGCGFALKGGSTYYAFFPYDGNATDRKAIPVDYSGRTVSGSDGLSELSKKDYLAASAVANSQSGASFQFKHLSSFARFTYPSISGKLTSVDMIPSEGEFTESYDYNVENDTKANVVTSARVNVQFGENYTPGSDSTQFWMPIAPEDFSGSEIFAVGTNGTDLYSSRFSGYDFKAGTAYRLSSKAMTKYTVSKTSNIKCTENSQVSLNDLGVAAGQYSAIVKVSDNVYAVVHDKVNGAGLIFFNLGFDSEGNVSSASALTSEGSAAAKDVRDPEGIAYVGGHFFVTGEGDQKILEYDMNGYPTGRELEIPSDLSLDGIQSNLGFESLTTAYGSDKKPVIMTITESSLKKDKDYAPVANYGPMLRLQSFDPETLKPLGRRLYLMDKPVFTKVPSTSSYVHGVSDILGLPDGRVVVMEREVNVNTTTYVLKVYVKLYVVDPINDKGAILSKTLLDSFDTGFTTENSQLKLTIANYEGMCLGPKLEDGTSTILLINDSQGGPSYTYTPMNMTLTLQDYIKTIKVKL